VITAVMVAVLVLLLLMTFEASVINLDCSLTDFLKGRCARWGRWWWSAPAQP
jgi:hypothetical protein